MKGRGCGGFLKRGLGQFADLKGVDTSMHTIRSQNNLKVMTNYYQKKNVS